MTPPTLSNEELKPCPFCGGKPAMLRASPGLGAVITCNGCEVAPSFGYETDESAIKAWNTRAIPPAAQTESEVGAAAGLEKAIRYEIRLGNKQLELLELRSADGPGTATMIRPFAHNLRSMIDRLESLLPVSESKQPPAAQQAGVSEAKRILANAANYVGHAPICRHPAKCDCGYDSMVAELNFFLTSNAQPSKVRECPDCTNGVWWKQLPNGEPEQVQCQRCGGTGYIKADAQPSSGEPGKRELEVTAGGGSTETSALKERFYRFQRKYAKHKPSCCTYGSGAPERKCNCGFDDALDAILGPHSDPPATATQPQSPCGPTNKE